MMRPGLGPCALAAAVGFFFTIGTVDAASLIAQHSGNGGSLQAQLTAGFDDPTGGDVGGGH